MPKAETLILTRGELEQLATIDDVIGAVEGALRAHGEGKVVMPPKISLDLGEKGEWPEYGAFINAMPAFVGPLEMAGIKWAGGFWTNVEKGFPNVMATLILNDPETGVARAIMEAGWITAIRTGAATAVGAKYLAKKGSGKVGLIGAGTQGEYQLMALDRVFDIQQVAVYDIRRDVSKAYVRKMSPQLNQDIRAAMSVEETVEGADVVVAATTGQEPFLDGSWLQEGCCVCAIGSYEEIHDNVVQVADKIVVDNLEQVKHRGGLAPKFERGLLTEEDVYAEIGEIVAGKKAGRESEEETILLVPIGMGSEDIATATMLYERAMEKGIGLKVDLLR
jgi:ornithine cyclodeaminase/alanine dehydrogenase